MPRNCSPTRSASAPRRGCSRSCARSRAWPIRSRAGASAYADCGLFWAYVATDRDDAALVAGEIERVLADAAASLEPRELDRARAQTKAAMMMSLESCWGQASYLATRLLRDGRLVEPAEIVARLDAVTLDEVRAAGRGDARRPAGLASVGANLALAA